MKALFLMSLFGLFMVTTVSSQSITHASFVSPAYADDLPALHCPSGVTTCFRAYTEGSDTNDDGEYTDINNLPATAAGSDGEDDESLVSVVKPTHFRSF